MTEKAEARFEEAEKKKGTILASIGVTCAALAWVSRGSTTFMGAMALLAAYLMTGDRYQWVYIWKKTFRRDMLGLRVLLRTMYRIWKWERTGTTVVTRFEEIARMQPDKKAFIMDNRSLTYREGDELSNRIAWYFKRQGFKSGEVIALVMETQPEYVFIWLGLAKLKVTTALVNTNLRGAQLIYCLKIVGCKAVIFGDELSDAIKEIQNEIRDIPLFQYNSSDRQSSPVLQDAVPLAVELNEMTSEPFDVVPAKPRDTLMYIYTSGTTGFPKAAIITNVRYLLIPLGAHTSARLTPDDIVYDPLPLHHTAGGVLGAGQALVLGCTVVLRKKFSASNYWSDAAKYGCTATQYIGEMCRYILAVPPGPNDRSHHVKTILGNGLRPQIWQEFVKRFGIEKVVEFYGATEGNSNLINLDSKVGAIGFLSRLVSSIYPLMLVRCDEITGEIYRDSNGRCTACGPHEPGLLLGKIDARKAILTFAGYADKTASEKKMVRNVKVEGDCYFNTGDIMVMDHFGYFYFKDRTGDTFRLFSSGKRPIGRPRYRWKDEVQKDLCALQKADWQEVAQRRKDWRALVSEAKILFGSLSQRSKWRGENVSTAEVEGVISTLVGLKDTIVYGVAIPNVEGRAGMAAIADPEKKLDLPLLASGLKKSLPVYARPLFLRILPEPPITATFKLKKKELLEQGFNPSVHADPMYFLDQKSGEYVPLTQKLYEDIVQGNIRL